MAMKESRGRKAFNIVNIIILSCITLICILPFIHLFAVSLSSGAATAAGEVGLFPKEVSIEAYKYL
ncbi:MAG: carbohydrate ABC transporter permease, partial [Clostridium sp.]